MFDFILLLHILSGSISLITGTWAMFSRKGGSRHRTVGKIFLTAMTITAVSSILLSTINPSSFLLAIGLFTLYLVISGWTWARNGPPHYQKRLTQAIGFVGIGFAGFMLFRALITGGNSGAILLVFGGILLILGISDFTIPKTKLSYVPRHAGRMGGAYIAAVTAFLVVNVDFLPGLVVWLGPTVVGSVFISILITHWKRQHA